MRLAISALASAALIAAPVAAQTPTLKLNGPPLATALGEPVAKTWATWQDQQRRALLMIKPPVGDVAEPELGANFDKLLTPIASNFPTEPLLVPSWGSGGIAVKGTEGTGAFRFNCSAGQVLKDDPIVWPGQPGKSHWHQFFGNTSANAFSTYASLRTTGDSTCVNKLIRSAYWTPVMLDGKGHIVVWEFTQTYYKRDPDGTPGCTKVAQRCALMPAGMRFVFGYDMITGKTPTGAPYFKCNGPTAGEGAFRYIAEVAKVCPAGNYITASLSSPFCWDGKRLDSPNHRDHVGYAGFGNTGQLRCPETHPVGIPQFSSQFFYKVEAGDDPSQWYFSSDDMTGMGMGRVAGGTTFHEDFFEAEDEPTKLTWGANCIQLVLSCNGGDLGNGKQLKDTTGFNVKKFQRLVPVPPAGAPL